MPMQIFLKIYFESEEMDVGRGSNEAGLKTNSTPAQKRSCNARCRERSYMIED